MNKMLLIFLIYFIKKLVRVLYYYSFYGCNQEINYCSGQILQKSKLKQNKFHHRWRRGNWQIWIISGLKLMVGDFVFAIIVMDSIINGKLFLSTMETYTRN